MIETLFTGISQLVSPRPGPQRGKAMSELVVMRDAAILVRGDLIEWIGPERGAPQTAQVVDLGGVAVVPGLIDPHNHVGFGDPENDFWTETRSAALGRLPRGRFCRKAVAAMVCPLWQ